MSHDQKIHVPAVYLSQRYNFVLKNGEIVPQKNFRKRYQYWEQYDGRELTKEEKDFLMKCATNGDNSASAAEKKRFAEASQMYKKRQIGDALRMRPVYEGYSVLKGMSKQCADAKGDALVGTYALKRYTYDAGVLTLRKKNEHLDLPSINLLVGKFIAKTKILELTNITSGDDAINTGTFATILYVIFSQELTDKKLDKMEPEKLVELFFTHHGSVTYGGNIRDIIH